MLKTVTKVSISLVNMNEIRGRKKPCLLQVRLVLVPTRLVPEPQVCVQQCYFLMQLQFAFTMSMVHVNSKIVIVTQNK